MSLGSQGSFAAGRVTLSLSKFSYATVNGERNTPIPWFHIGTTDNLFAIFESQRVEDGRGQARDVKKFKVLNDPEVLEDIDLDVLASEANRAKAEAQNPRTNAMLVTVIVKMPCIAIRYPLQGGKIRRIQIRLASNDDYFETLKILTRANVPFGDAGSFPTQPQPARPFSSSSSLLRPSDSASQFGARPVSASSKIGEFSSAHGDGGVRWTSASSMRPSTASGLAYGGPSGQINNYFGQLGRSPGTLGNPSLHFSGAPPTKSSASDVVSGYFGRQKDLHSFHQPQALGLDYTGSPGRIDLYQPRPSTAPINRVRILSQMPPPKRELPFSSTAPTKKMRGVSTRLDDAKDDTELRTKALPTSPRSDPSRPRSSVLDVVSAMETTSEVSVNSATTKGKRASATRTPKPRAPKKQPVKVPAKITAKRVAPTGKEIDTVPSVKQLLKENDDQSNDTVDRIPTINTQTLLSRVEATRPYQRTELPEPFKQTVSQVSNSSTQSSQTRKCDRCRTRKGKCNGQEYCDWCLDLDLICTYEAPADPATQVLVPSSQPEFVAEALKIVSPTAGEKTIEPSQEVVPSKEEIANAPQAVVQEALAAKDHTPRERRSQETMPPCIQEAQSFDPDVTVINTPPFPPNIGITKSLHLSPPADPLALLLHEPAFAPTPSSDHGPISLSLCNAAASTRGCVHNSATLGSRRW